MVQKIARVWISIAGMTIIGLMIAYGSFMAVYYYTSTPQFCSSCHYVEPYVTSWEKSPHQNVNCMLCHEPIGSLGKLHSKARGLNYYISDKTGNYIKPIIYAPFISETRCFGCHIGKIKDYPDAAGINDDREHLQYIKNEQNCTDCHNDIGHGLNLGVDKIFPAP